MSVENSLRNLETTIRELVAQKKTNGGNGEAVAIARLEERVATLEKAEDNRRSLYIQVWAAIITSVLSLASSVIVYFLTKGIKV